MAHTRAVSACPDQSPAVENTATAAAEHTPEKLLTAAVGRCVIGGAKSNVGETVLYKLLYFIDFDFYEKYEEQLMGLTYIKNTHGPTPREFKLVVDEMVSEGLVDKVSSKHFTYTQKKYLPVVKPDLKLLNAAELAMVDSVLDRYSDHSAAQLSQLSHDDTPWQMAGDKENIEYEYAFYRPERFSVREYDAL